MHLPVHALNFNWAVRFLHLVTADDPPTPEPGGLPEVSAFILSLYGNNDDRVLDRDQNSLIGWRSCDPQNKQGLSFGRFLLFCLMKALERNTFSVSNYPFVCGLWCSSWFYPLSVHFVAKLLKKKSLPQDWFDWDYVCVFLFCYILSTQTLIS